MYDVIRRITFHQKDTRHVLSAQAPVTGAHRPCVEAHAAAMPAPAPFLIATLLSEHILLVLGLGGLLVK